MNEELDATGLLKNHRIFKERIPGTTIRMRDILYFRADDVIALLQKRNQDLQAITERLKAVAERNKEREARIRELEDRLRKYETESESTIN